MAASLKNSCDVFKEVTTALHTGLLAYASVQFMPQSCMDCMESIFGATRQNSHPHHVKLQETDLNRF